MWSCCEFFSRFKFYVASGWLVRLILRAAESAFNVHCQIMQLYISLPILLIRILDTHICECTYACKQGVIKLAI